MYVRMYLIYYYLTAANNYSAIVHSSFTSIIYLLYYFCSVVLSLVYTSPSFALMTHDAFYTYTCLVFFILNIDSLDRTSVALPS